MKVVKASTNAAVQLWTFGLNLSTITLFSHKTQRVVYDFSAEKRILMLLLLGAEKGHDLAIVAARAHSIGAHSWSLPFLL